MTNAIECSATSMTEGAARPTLLVRIAGKVCGIDVMHVIEVLRPLPAGEVAGAPEIVAGVSIIRGHPVPVIELSSLFGEAGTAPGRLVLMRTGGRRAALAVESVLGIFSIEREVFEALPPLLSKAGAGRIAEIGTLDSDLLFVLNTASLVPEEVWRATALRDQ